MRTIGSEVAEVVARRFNRAGIVSSACGTARAAGPSCRRPCAVALAAFRQSRSWLIRAIYATQANTLPRRASPPHLPIATFPGTEVHPFADLMKSRVCAPRIAIRARAAGFLFPEPPNKAPEPTSHSVTPRAVSRESEMKHCTDNRHAARVAPERAVAHL